LTCLEEALRDSAAAVNAKLDALIPTSKDLDGRLFKAMRYSIMAGGKRLRPFLVLSAADLFDVPRDWSIPPAAAIEMVHTYSLVHGDLPAMDDDDLRRNRPTVHVAFNEATAILAGDTLLTLAFEILGDDLTHRDASVRIELVCALARAAGSQGMVGGQMRDLEGESSGLNLDTITDMQRLKTGALLEFACFAGARLGGASVKDLSALRGYARNIGLAFQITDDLLDAQSTTARAGKRTRKDAGQGKATFVAVLGFAGAKDKAETLIQNAIEHLAPFGEHADNLRQAAGYILQRQN